MELPVIDVAPLVATPFDEIDPAAPERADITDEESSAGSPLHAVASEIDGACRRHGFFCIVGHGIAPELLTEMDARAREFFAHPDHVKATISMERAGPAWRGWFPVGGELTSGRPDRKEGLYVGLDHGPDHPRVRVGTPLHGANLFPADPAGLGPAVTAWMDAVTPVAHALMRGIAMGLGLEPSWFRSHLTADPTVLFRIFHYPPGLVDEPTVASPDPVTWGVAEHTDYGLLTLLAQDATGGLQVRNPDDQDWIDVPAVPDVIVCNIGDMLDRLTEGRYRSTPHRVLNRNDRGRLSFPFFLDPSWDSTVTPLPLSDSPPADAGRDAARRWDGTSVHLWDGTYGEYLTAKVSNVFPELFAGVGEPG